jgi:hypothetical protein
MRGRCCTIAAGTRSWNGEGQLGFTREWPDLRRVAHGTPSIEERIRLLSGDPAFFVLPAFPTAAGTVLRAEATDTTRHFLEFRRTFFSMWRPPVVRGAQSERGMIPLDRFNVLGH